MGANRLTILSTNPTTIFQAAQIDDYFVNNTGTVTVYLSDEPNVTVDQGAPLPPGATKKWERGYPLYAIAASGSGTMNMSRNSGDLTNPAAIASSLVTSGLATAIANAIYIAGTPPVDKPVILTFAQSSGNLSTGSTTWSSGRLNVEGYNSLILYPFLRALWPITGAPQNTYSVTATWFAADSATQDLTAQVYLLEDIGAVGITGGILPPRIVLPVLGPWVEFTFTTDSGFTASDQLAEFLCYGSLQQRTGAFQYYAPDAYDDIPAATSQTIHPPGFSTFTWSGGSFAVSPYSESATLNLVAGPGRITMSTTAAFTTAGGINAWIEADGFGAIGGWRGFTWAAARNLFTAEFIAPAGVCHLQVSNNTAAAVGGTLRLAVIQDLALLS